MDDYIPLNVAPDTFSEPLLPQGWTSHTAPTGHTYYHNASTGQSTYKRPSSFLPERPPPPVEPRAFKPQNAHVQANPFAITQNGLISGGQPKKRGPPPDRPKSRHKVPGLQDWVVVKTFLGRRFLHNEKSGESFWKIPEEVGKTVEKFDELERRKRAGEEVPELNSESKRGDDLNTEEARKEESDSEEYEEVEEVEVSDMEEDEPASKRPRIDSEPGAGEQEEQGPMELTEEDMAYQLAALEDQEHDPTDDYEMPEADDGESPMTEADAQAHFHDLLDDQKVNPFTIWDNLISSEKGEAFISDNRYTLLPNMRARKAAFQSWSTAAIQRQREEKAQEAKKDPRVPYLRFLHEKATPKLYWPEFRKKYRKEDVMNDRKLGDKDRERLYRDYVNRVSKKSDSERKDDLWDLMKTIPASPTWNRDSDLDGNSLPEILSADVGFAVVKSGSRERLMKEFLKRLPYADELDEEGESTGNNERNEQRRERQRRNEALDERRRKVEEAKRRQQRDTKDGKEMLLQEEAKLRRAMNVDKSGLKDHLIQ